MFCLVCENQVENFLSYGIPPKVGQCPHCGAKGRHREMALFLKKYVDNKNLKILEIGPSKVTVNYLWRPQIVGPSKVTAIDIRRLKHHKVIKNPHEFIEMDACKMDFADEIFDLIICNHVLPYIPEDQKALEEIFRVLKSNGLAILNTHISQRDKTLRVEELSQLDPQLFNADYFAENGTEREYGKDFWQLLKQVGYKACTYDLFANWSEQKLKENGIKRDEFVLAAKSAKILEEIKK